MTTQPLDLTSALAAPRVVIEAELEPLIGSRIQPTGFPNLGAAEFFEPNGARFLLVESAQSIANRLEAVSWDDSAVDLVGPLRGLPYVKTTVGGVETDSIREAHRLNSPYLYGVWPLIADRAGITMLKGKKGKKATATTTDGDGEDEAASASVDRQKLARAVFYYDPNSVLHGVFLEKITGLARLTRAVSGFVEAHEVALVASGGVKNDRIDPSGKAYKGEKSGAEGGFGNVPYARTEYTAKRIVASFAIDTSLVRSYGLGDAAERLLLALALWKIANLLKNGMRLRTACDLVVKPDGLKVTRPASASLPAISELEREIASGIAACAASETFAPDVTPVKFEK
jgi:CRISPR-associated protein Csb1